MSYNGSGTFNINTSGQPVVAGTVITATAFNLLTADLATGLTTAMTKDGQTTTTARIPFAQGISSTLVTDATNTTSGSIITDGGVGIAKALYVGTTANVGSTTDSSSISTGSIITAGGVGIAKNLYVGGTLNVTGSTSLTNPVINNIKMGYSTTATAAGTTTLTISSNYRQFFTGTLAQTIVLPVTSTLVTGIAYEIENNSTGLLTVNSSGGNLVGTIPAGVCAHAVCIGTTLTTAADWDWDYISTTTITGTGANVLGTSPIITTPTISSLSSAAATALTLQSAGTTAITVDTSQNVGIGVTSPAAKLEVVAGTGSVSTGWFRTGDATAANNAGGGFQATSSATAGSRSSKMWLDADGANFAGSDYFYIDKTGNSGDVALIQQSNANMTFQTNGSERMRILSTGQVLIDRTTNTDNGKLEIYGNSDGAFNPLCVIQGAAGSTSRTSISFYRTSASAVVGTIQTTNTATSYNTSSDYRLKENIAPMMGALAKVAQLKPVTYKWKIDGAGGEGFIAHELAEVCPHAVSGEKDATREQEYEVTPAVKDEEGNITTPAVMGTRTVPVYQGIDTSFLVATLTAAIQELKAINDTQAETINALTARITALENA